MPDGLTGSTENPSQGIGATADTSTQAKIIVPGAHEILGQPYTLYRYVSIETLPQVSSQGIHDEDTPLGNPEVENIFSDAAKSLGIGFDRRNAIIAYPRHPSQLKSQDINQATKLNVALVEITVDPGINAIVVDSARFDEVAARLARDERQNAFDFAQEYWEKAKTLQEYMSESHHGAENDFGDFEIPEVLIFEPIPNNRIKVVNK